MFWFWILVGLDYDGWWVVCCCEVDFFVCCGCGCFGGGSVWIGGEFGCECKSVCDGYGMVNFVYVFFFYWDVV